MERHFTTTVYIFHQERVLLHLHEKLQKWLPPGGHLELNETPPEGARREVREETGLEIAFIEEENLRIKETYGASFERPFLCLLENIPPYRDEPAHQHMDLIYLAKPIELKRNLDPFQWFSYEQLEDLDLFPDTSQVLHYLLYQRRCCLS